MVIIDSPRECGTNMRNTLLVNSGPAGWENVEEHPSGTEINSHTVLQHAHVTIHRPTDFCVIYFLFFPAMINRQFNKRSFFKLRLVNICYHCVI